MIRQCLYHLDHILYIVYAAVQISQHGKLQMQKHVLQATRIVLRRVAERELQVYPLAEVRRQRHVLQIALTRQHRLQVPIAARYESGVVSILQVAVLVQPAAELFKHFWELGLVIHHVLYDSGQLRAERSEAGMDSRLDVLVKSVLYLPGLGGDSCAWEFDDLLRFYFLELLASGFEVHHQQVIEGLLYFVGTFVNGPRVLLQYSLSHGSWRS